MNLNKEPIYRQLTGILKKSVTDGGFAPGDQFLTEKHICESYNVSRATAGKALSALVAEGLLEFKKGVGTFVKEKTSPHDLQSLISFSAMARELGKQPKTEVMEFERMSAEEAGETACERLGCEEDLLYCRRIRLLDGRPSLLDRRFIRSSLSPDLGEEDLRGSLICYWTETQFLSIGSIEQLISAVSLTEPEAEVLECSPGECALRLQSVGFLENGEALWYEDSLFPGNQYLIKNRVDNLSGFLPARRIFVGES